MRPTRHVVALSALVVVVVGSLAALAVLRRAGYDVVPFQAAVFVGHWTPLSERPWVRASSGWVAFGNTGAPKVDESFINTSLTIGSQEFDHGLGAFAPSEIAYDLDGSDALFRATIGINEGGPPDAGSATFTVFLDDVPLYTSPPISAGQPGQVITVPLTAPGHLRLVAEPAGPLSPWNLATWGDARILQSTATLGVPQELGIAIQAARRRASNATLRGAAENRLSARSDARASEIESALGPAAEGQPATAAFDQEHGDWLIGNGKIAVVLGVGEQSRGEVTVAQRDPPRLIVDGASSTVELGGDAYRLLDGTPTNDGVEPAPADVPGFGPGLSITVPFAFLDGTEIQVGVTVLDDSPAFLYSLDPSDAERDGTATYSYLDGENSLLLGDGAQYLTDVSRIRSGAIRDDGLARRESIDFGKPLLFWGGSLGDGLLLSTVDETDLMSELAVTLGPGQLQANIHYASRRSHPMGAAPRLYVEVTGEAEPRRAFDRYRDAMAELYPSPPPPPGLRYQWSTWYVYFMSISDDAIRSQIDYISQNLGDLGPWQIVIDAGWYVAEGRPDSGFEHVDRDKFPRGIRPVVDYAHAHGMKVALYLSVPYLDAREQHDDWLGLRGVIDNDRACLTVLGADPTGASYAFDFDRPCTQRYWQSVLNNYFQTYDVDGLVVDGLGYAEGAKVSPRRLDPVGIVDRVAEQSVQIYRFMYETATQLKPNIYLEGGWHFPMMAKPYVSAFWLSDTTANFSYPYPFIGLEETVDYAAFQRVALGQPSHMGWTNTVGDDEEVNRWRIEAALALGGFFGDGRDLLNMEPRDLAAFRARLAQVRPFEGTTTVDDPQRPTVFGTVRDDTAFIGMLNRSKSPAGIRAQLADFGLSAGAPYTVYSPEDDTAHLARAAINANLPGQSFRLSVVPLRPGVVWTDSSYTQQRSRDALTVTLRGPSSVNGFAVVYVPDLKSVSMDGRPLTAAAPGLLGRVFQGEYQYDQETGILRVRYDHRRPHVLRVGTASASPAG